MRARDPRRGPSTHELDFADIVRPELDRLLRSAVLLCGDWHQAEDLVQTVLTRVYASGRWRKADRPYDYLRKSVTNEFLARRRLRSARTISLTDSIDEGLFGSWEDPDPAARIDLLNALGQLSALDRAVLVLRYFEDLSVNDTAAMLNTSAGAVRTRSGRALAKVRDLLDPARCATPVETTGRKPS